MMIAMRFLLVLGVLCGAAPIVAQVESVAPVPAPASQVSVQPVPTAPQSPAVGEPESGSAEADAGESVPAPEGPSPAQLARDLRNRSRSIVLLGSDVRVLPGDTVREVVVIGGSAQIEGRVLQNVVVVGGDIDLEEGASVDWDMVNVFGTTTIAEGASIGRELVVVGGRLEAPFQFRAGRSQNVVSLPRGLQSFVSGVFPWVTGGWLWGRVVVPGLPWMWGIVGIVSLVYLSIGFLFPVAVARIAAPIEDRPLSTFIAGLVALILAGPIVFLLGVSMVGIVVIPFFLAALVVATLFGRVAVASRLAEVQSTRVARQGNRAPGALPLAPDESRSH
jgi:hypothetical protein